MSMPNINLIAERRAEQLQLMRLTRHLFLALAGSCAITLCLTLFLTAERWQMEAESQAADTKLAKLKPTLDSIAKVKADTDSLKPKVDTLKSAKDGTTKWRVALQSISDSMPPATYLTAMNTTGTADDTTLVLTGVSDSQTIVGDLMTRLGSHPLYDHVDLHYTQAAISLTPGVSADSGSIHPMQFEMTAHLKGAPTPPPAPAPVKKD